MTRSHAAEAGFTLIEVMVAMSLVAAGALGLAAVVSLGARASLGSQGQLVASERAAEAVESVFKARDSSLLTWAQIRNVHGATGADGGVFLDGPQNICDPGPDGLVNTTDDGAIAVVVTPGRDGLFGTNDDVKVPLTGYTREINIRDISINLRQLVVTVTYPTFSGKATYVLTTYISSYA